ncbi:hypothetical protein ACJJIE_14750 [Microbulbifer sp. TRSA001]|uniref:hypothetical protein n=1 Tax=Microbulbifer sp. TRSA001 TaxID=3243381 RepID=UPI00403954EB
MAEENEDIRLRVFPRQNVVDAMRGNYGPGENPIDNATTLISVQWLELNRKQFTHMTPPS